MEWLFGHMDDPSIDQPLKKTPKSTSAPSFSEASVEQLMNMGFDRPRCIKALQSTDNNFERALDWLFSHGDDPMEEEKPKATASAPALSNARGRYRLMGFVTHMGKSTESGHYVAHIFTGGKWVIFNDLKVAESQQPPREMAYIYFYRREDI